MLARPSFFTISIFNFANVFSRNLYNTAPSLGYLPHAFSAEEANRRLVEANANHLFAPSIPKNNNQLTLANSNPLKKALVPFFGINALIDNTTYKGRYGIDRLVVTHKSTYIYTDWYPISGTLKSHQYTNNSPNMSIYGGYSWPALTVERAFNDFNISPALQTFSPNVIEEGIFIDPFLKRSAIGSAIGLETAKIRIDKAETSRIEKDIKKKIFCCDHIEITKMSIQYNQFHLSSYLLPAYILQYTETPPQILPAMSADNIKVYGSSPISVTKCATASFITTSILTILFPEIGLPVRIASVFFGTIATAVFAYYKPSIQYSFQEAKLKADLKHNESVSETIADKKRFEATAKNFSTFSNSNILHIDPTFYQIMGLDPSKAVTEEIVHQAFNAKIKEMHPDRGGKQPQRKN